MKKMLFATASLVALSLANAANAQEMDYGQLSQMFGEPVTTSATGSPQRATDVPADMDIITAEDIRHFGAHNIPEILQFVTGMDVRQYGAENYEANVRGEIQTTTPRLLVLVNGRQVYLDYFGYVPWSAIPVQMSEIRQIEVVRGPGTALFGANAYSGVINIITYSPLKDDVKTVQGAVGTQAYRNGSAVITHRFFDNTLGVKLAGGYFRSHEFAVQPDAKVRSMSADVRWQVTPKLEVSVEGTRADTKDYELSSMYNFGNIQYGTTSFRANVLADTEFGLIALEGYNNHANIKKHLGTIDLAYSNDLISSKLSDTFKLGTDHTFRLSLEYRDTNNNVTAPATPGALVGYKVWSGAAMWNWQITPKVALTNSARIDSLGMYWDGPYPTLKAGAPTKDDYNNKSLNTFTYNSGLVWKVTDLDTVRVLLGRGVQLPSLLAFSYLGSATTTYAPPYAINLKPSYQDSYEIGYDRRIPEINSNFSLKVFHLVSTNLLAYARANDGSSIQNGFEMELKGKSESGWRWNASYAFKSISDKIGLPAGTGTNLLNFEDGTPGSRLIAGIGNNFGDFEVDLKGRWQSSYIDWYTAGFSGTPHPTHIDSFFTLNARVAYNITDYLTVALSGSQLTQPTQKQTAGAPRERRLYLTTTLNL
jgi:iron complex outermembrane receptor protein